MAKLTSFSVSDAPGHQVASHLAARVSAKYPRGLEHARFCFESIARRVWPSDAGDGQGRRDENSPVGLAAPAAG